MHLLPWASHAIRRLFISGWGFLMAVIDRCGSCGRLIKESALGVVPSECPDCGQPLSSSGAPPSSTEISSVVGHDVFISFSSKNASTADAVCAALEKKGVRCWVAPRDIPAGSDWAGAIIDGIGASRIMVLIYSADANRSPQVLREVERAVNKEVAIIPFRIEAVPLSKAMEYFISSSHWFDALEGSLESHLAQLLSAVQALLASRPTALPPNNIAARFPPSKSRWRQVGIPALLGLSLVGYFIVYTMRTRSAASATPSPVIARNHPTTTVAAPGTATVVLDRLAGLLSKAGKPPHRPTAPGTRPAQLTPDPPKFISLPASPVLYPHDRSDVPPDARGPYTVVVDYTDPDGREYLKHTYLQLDGPGKPQTIMYYALTSSQQWSEQGYHLRNPGATKTPIERGYRVTYHFQLDDAWGSTSPVSFTTWVLDVEDAESTHAAQNWSGHYQSANSPTSQSK